MLPYISAKVSKAFESEADTTLAILSTVCSLSHGLILSGEYQRLKSDGHFNQLFSSKIGKQISSVAPGSTVDSYTTICHFFKIEPIVSEALIKGV
jgi:hypothetical protein